MTLSIADALDHVQQALNGGDVNTAAATCQQLVGQFPGCGTAWRLLGEAWRELGQTNDAERAYTAALARNPRQAGAWLGLGLVAEEHGAMDAALAYCQVAWELAPAQQAMREPLLRVAMRRYGSDGDLQLTRPGLAQLHASAARLRRAVVEYRTALAELPDRIDLRLGLAEVLWRLGQNAEARRLAEEVLERYPEAAPALVVLADLERRHGDARRAEELRKRLRAADPDGAVVAAMLALNPVADRAFLELAPAALPTVGGTMAAPAEWPRTRDAVPDFEYRPARYDTPAADIDELLPISLDELGAAEPAAAASDVTDLPEDLQPITLEELGISGQVPDQRIVNLDLPEDLEPISFEDLGGEPVDFLQQETPAAPAPADDDIASLAAALGDEVAEALARAGEPLSDLDRDVPPDTPPSGYTTVLRSLDAEGFAPFDPHARPPVIPPSTPEAIDGDELGEITRGWDNIDDEIQQAMPSAGLHGYTDELRALDEIGLAPFEVEDVEQELEGVVPFNPFSVEPQPPAGPRASGTAAAGEDPELDALLGGLEPFSVEEFERPAPSGSSTTSLFGQAAWHGDSGSAVPSDEDLEALLAMGEDDELEELAAEPATAEPLSTVFPDMGVLDARWVSPTRELDAPLDAPLDPVQPAMDPYALDARDDLEATAAVTRQLDPELQPGPHAQSAPEAPAAADAEERETPFDSLPLRPGTEVFTRARALKHGLVSGGLISGDRELDLGMSTDELHALEDSLDTRHLGGDEVAEPSGMTTVGATRDTNTLRAALEVTPDDDELRWWLAEALRQRGDLGEAYQEYRWLIRHAPHRHDAVIGALLACVDADPAPEMPHRLLGDIYRRRGDVSRASSHAALALQVRRRGSRVR